MRKVYLGVGERYPCESVRHARNISAKLAGEVYLFLDKIYSKDEYMRNYLRWCGYVCKKYNCLWVDYAKMPYISG